MRHSTVSSTSSPSPALYSHSSLKVAVTSLCISHGWQGVQRGAIDLLSSLLERRILAIVSGVRHFAESGQILFFSNILIFIS